MVLHDISAEAPPGGSAEPHTESASAVNFMAGSKKKKLADFSHMNWKVTRRTCRPSSLLFAVEIH